MISYLTLKEQTTLLEIEESLINSKQLLQRLTSSYTNKVISDFTKNILEIIKNLSSLPQDKIKEIKQRQFSKVCGEWIPNIEQINTEFVLLLKNISEVNLISMEDGDADFSEITTNLARKITGAKVQFTAIRLNLERLMPQLTEMLQQEQTIAKKSLDLSGKLAVALESSCRQINLLLECKKDHEDLISKTTLEVEQLYKNYAKIKELYLEFHRNIETEKSLKEQSHQELPNLYEKKITLIEGSLKTALDLSKTLEKKPNLNTSEQHWLLILTKNPKLAIEQIDPSQHSNIYNAIRTCMPLVKILREIDDIELAIERLIRKISLPPAPIQLSDSLQKKHKNILELVALLHYEASKLQKKITEQLSLYDRAATSESLKTHQRRSNSR